MVCRVARAGAGAGHGHLDAWRADGRRSLGVPACCRHVSRRAAPLILTTQHGTRGCIHIGRYALYSHMAATCRHSQ